jgi:uncharacterized protein YgiM (DUF1202 family)
MKTIIKKVSAIAMAFTLFGAGTSIAKSISPSTSYTISANAAFQPYVAVVKGDDIKNLNVRKGPGTNYDILYSIPVGTRVAIIEEKYGWGKISTENGGQWIYLEYTTEKSTSTTKSYRTYISTIIHDDTIVYSEPNKKSKKIDIKLSAGTQIGILRQKGVWFQISTADGGWWVYTSDIEKPLKKPNL